MLALGWGGVRECGRSEFGGGGVGRRLSSSSSPFLFRVALALLPTPHLAFIFPSPILTSLTTLLSLPHPHSTPPTLHSRPRHPIHAPLCLPPRYLSLYLSRRKSKRLPVDDHNLCAPFQREWPRQVDSPSRADSRARRRGSATRALPPPTHSSNLLAVRIVRGQLAWYSATPR